MVDSNNIEIMRENIRDLMIDDLSNRREVSEIKTNLGDPEEAEGVEGESAFSKISAINNNITTINGNLTTINNDITTINGNLTTINNDITTINGKLTTINNDITTINGNLTTINNKIGYTIKTHTGGNYYTILSRVANVVTLTIHTANLISNGASIGTAHIDWKPKNAQSYVTIAWFPSENKMGRVYVSIATNGNISFSALDINNSFYIPCTTVIYETT